MILNNLQRAIMILSGVVILAMVTFPPKTFEAYNQLDGTTEVYAGYDFIGTLHTNEIKPLLERNNRPMASIYQIDETRLIFQLVGVLLFTFLTVVGFHDVKTNLSFKRIRKTEKKKVSTSEIAGGLIIGIGLISTGYLIVQLITKDFENTIGFLVGYFSIPVILLITGGIIFSLGRKS